jgi:hypothetical protein
MNLKAYLETTTAYNIFCIEILYERIAISGSTSKPYDMSIQYDSILNYNIQYCSQ